MPALAFLAVVGLVALASLVAIVDRSGVPKVSHHGYLPFTNQGRVAASAPVYLPRSNPGRDGAPAPAPDMTSPLVLASQPAPEVPAKIESASPPEDRSATTHQKQTAARHRRAALEARAEAPSTRKHVASRPVEYRQKNASVGISRLLGVREFGLSGTN